MKHITLGTPPICPQPGDGPADEETAPRLGTLISLRAHSARVILSSLFSIFAPVNPTQPIKSTVGPVLRKHRHGPIAISLIHHHTHTHTDQDPITHLTSSQLTDPCPYQDNRILPNLANVPPSLIPFRPCKRPDHVWPSCQGSHIPIHHSVPPGPDRRPKREVHGPASELPWQPALEIPSGLVGVLDGGPGGWEGWARMRMTS